MVYRATDYFLESVAFFLSAVAGRLLTVAFFWPTVDRLEGDARFRVEDLRALFDVFALAADEAVGSLPVDFFRATPFEREREATPRLTMMACPG